MSETPPLVAGETLIDFVPATAGPLAKVESFDRRAGGAPANVAVGLARLGEPPLFWTRVGADPFGEFLVDRLAAEGIPERFLERDGEAATTLAFVSGAEEGKNGEEGEEGKKGEKGEKGEGEIGEEGEEEPRFTFYRDDTADTRLDPGTVPDETLEAAPWVHAGGVTLAAEPARSATLDLLDRAADHDCTVSFDPNVRPELWSNDAELATICGWAIEETDVLIATPAELETLGATGDDPRALAEDATAMGPHTVVSTLGEAGALAVATEDAPWGPASVSQEGYEVDAVDDTGAGDAFSAGLIDALHHDASHDEAAATGLEHALAFANAVAAISTTERGAMEALPGRAAVQALLES